MINKGFIILVLIGGYLSTQGGAIGSNVNNCTITSENIAIFTAEDFQYEVRVIFNKITKEPSDGVISGTNILCDNGNSNCPVVVKTSLANCSDDTGSTFDCSFNSNRTITFNKTKINFQIKVIIKKISDAQKNETLNFTMTAELVKSLFSEKKSGKVSFIYCAPETTSTTPVSTPRINYTYSNGNYCMIDNIALFKGKDIQYRIIVDFDKRIKTGNNEDITSGSILCDNDTSHCPVAVTATLVDCTSGTNQTFDCPINSYAIEFKKTKIDLQIKVIIKNTSDIREYKALNFIVSNEFLKILFSKLKPGKASLTNCSLKVPIPTLPPAPTADVPTQMSNESYCLIDSQNITLFNDVQYQIIVDIDKKDKAESVGVIKSRIISCHNDSSLCLVVVKAKLANCDNNTRLTFDCLLNSTHTILINDTQIDLQKVYIKNITGIQKNESFSFAVSIEFFKGLFSSEAFPRKINITKCSLEEIQTTVVPTPTTFITASFTVTATNTSATPGKKQKSKSSNGKIALVVVAFFILLGVAVIGCCFKYRKKLSNRPAYYNDISLNDPLHTEIKFYKADVEDVEDNVEEDDDDVLPLI